MSDTDIYRLKTEIAIEDFGERSLALHCEDLRLVELNATARDWLYRLDGASTLRQLAEIVAADYEQPVEVVLADVQELLAQLLELDLVEAVLPEA